MGDVINMTIGEKVRAVRLEKGFSQQKLQQESGVERNFLSLVENNHRSPSFRTLMRIAGALGVSVGYITDYDKSCREDELRGGKQVPIVKTLQQVLAEGEAAPSPIDRTQFFPTPVINETSLAAGLDKFAEKDIEDYVFISSKWIGVPIDTGRYRCLWVKEDRKALPPLVSAGSLVCLDSFQRDPQQLEGEIVVFHDPEGGCTIRRLRRQGEHILGLLEKPLQQPPLIIPASKPGAILGKVIWCWSKFGG